VSKDWNTLCFDGTLWQDMDLSAFAGVMPIDVLNRLLSSTGHWTNNLSLRGMDAFPGSALVAPARGRWSFLTNVDLRGCRSLDESHLVGMMENAPYLFKVCLQGVQATTPTVLAALAQHCRWVVRLNISRCWQLSSQPLPVAKDCRSQSQISRSVNCDANDR
jgi:F-box/leucine-rich repeat protein 2/20